MTERPPCYTLVEIESFEILDMIGSLMKLKVKWSYQCVAFTPPESDDMTPCPPLTDCQSESQQITSTIDVPLLAVIPDAGGEELIQCIKCMGYCGGIENRTIREKCLDRCEGPNPYNGRTDCPDGLESAIDDYNLWAWWNRAMLTGDLSNFACPCKSIYAGCSDCSTLNRKHIWRIQNLLRNFFDDLCKQYSSN